MSRWYSNDCFVLQVILTLFMELNCQCRYHIRENVSWCFVVVVWSLCSTPTVASFTSIPTVPRMNGGLGIMHFVIYSGLLHFDSNTCDVICGLTYRSKTAAFHLEMHNLNGDQVYLHMWEATFVYCKKISMLEYGKSLLNHNRCSFAYGKSNIKESQFLSWR